MAESDPYRLPDKPEEVNPYVAPKAELAPRLPYDAAPDESGLVLEPFSIDAVLRRAWAIYKEHLGVTMGVTLGFILIAVGYQLIGAEIVQRMQAQGASTVATGLAQFVYVLSLYGLQCWLTLGMNLALLKLSRGQEAKVEDLFGGGRYFWRYVGAAILMGLALFAVLFLGGILVGLAFAIVGASSAPTGIALAIAIPVGLVGVVFVLVIAVRLYQFPFVLVDRDCGAIEALNGSIAMTKGHVLELIGVFILTGLIAISGVLALCVGFLFTYPLSVLITACTYVLLSGRSGSVAGMKPRGDLEFLDFES